MSTTMWGGRFKNKVDDQFFEFQKSIHYDNKLVEYDLYHSLIHIGALYQAAVLTKKEYTALLHALTALLRQVHEGEFSYNKQAEDVHTDIQNRLEQKVGAVALKLQTFRSRNDQIAFDEKWYCAHEATNILYLLNGLMTSLTFISKKYHDCHIPGYTHTQRAQVVSVSDYIGTYSAMYSRDFDRIDGFVNRLCIYIGAGALAGSPLSKDQYQRAIEKFLGTFQKRSKYALITVAKNSLDNVSDRDFIVEFLNDLALIQMHLSRMAEDFIIYATKEFCFFDLPEEFCTGSSLMPHKKNPDFLELIRGQTGKIYGNVIAILTIMKGLPLTYNRDMQLDKEPLFSSVDTVKEELSLMSEFVSKLVLNEERVQEVLADESLYATELAEFLVYQGVPFKQAHHIVGRIVRYANDNKINIKDIPDKILKTFHRTLDQHIVQTVMCPGYAVASKRSAAKRLPQLKKKIV